jgi:glyoxylase-like metal-dependent hydrolase (beta-lactamase superfamily II)
MDTEIFCLIVGPLQTNCWIYRAGDEVYIIDPGAEGEKIEAFLTRKQFKPSAILLTHGHFDHIDALPYLGKRYAGIPCEIHADDAEYVGKGAAAARQADLQSVMEGSIPGVLQQGESAMPPVSRRLAEGDTIGPFTVLHTPGHTRGSVCFYDREAGVLFSGDTMFRQGCGRTDLQGGSSTAMRESIRRLLQLPPQTTVHPGHDASTTIAAELPTYGRL